MHLLLTLALLWRFSAATPVPPGACLKEFRLECMDDSDCYLPAPCSCLEGVPFCQQDNGIVDGDSCTTTSGEWCSCKIDAGVCITGSSTSTSFEEGVEGVCSNYPDLSCDTARGGCVFTGEIGCSCVDGIAQCSSSELGFPFDETCSLTTTTDSSSPVAECECYVNLGECLEPQVCSNQILVSCNADYDCLLNQECSCLEDTPVCADPLYGELDYNCCSEFGGSCGCQFSAGFCVPYNGSLSTTTSSSVPWPGTCELNNSINCLPDVGGCVYNEACACFDGVPFCYGDVAYNPRSFVQIDQCGSSSVDQCTCVTNYGACQLSSTTVPTPTPTPVPDCTLGLIYLDQLLALPPSQFYDLIGVGDRDIWICRRLQETESGLDFGPLNYLQMHSSSGKTIDWLKLYKAYIPISISINSSKTNPCNVNAEDVLAVEIIECHALIRDVLQTAFPISMRNPTFPYCGQPLPQIVGSIPIDKTKLTECYNRYKTLSSGPV